MSRANRKKKRRIKWMSPSSRVRLVIFLGVIGLGLMWIWFSMFQMPKESYSGTFSPLTSDEMELRTALQADVKTLATDIGPRNYSRPQQLNAAKLFLEEQLTQSGYAVQEQSYSFNGQSYVNLMAERVGTETPDEVIVIGGHYDSAFNAPGANDNGTGAAATLELAKLFAQRSPQRTIRFVEFTNEEPPFFWTQNMGSLIYAKQAKQNKEKIVAMLSLETMGYYSDERQSQHYPFPLNRIYPDQGNFIGFVGNLNSGTLLRQAIASFRTHTQFPSEGVSIPAWIRGVGWSDQWSFWQQGYPGIMVTDTAPFRYPHYHTEDDTLDKINFDHLSRVVLGLSQVILDLSES